jgi:hypothetical protein
LLATLREIQAAGEKAIIFCEFREIRRMLRHYIEQVFGFGPDIITAMRQPRRIMLPVVRSASSLSRRRQAK